MKRAVALVALVLAGCANAQPARTGGIVSTNPCADQLLVALAPPDRIAAISHYSQEPGATSIPLDVARRFRGTAGTAEEVIALRPDLVLASSFTQKPTLAAYERAGLKVLLLDSPTTIAASEDQIRSVAAALGRPEAGAAMIATIDKAVAEAVPRDAARPHALLFISNSFANGGSSLLTEMLTRAGFGDASKDYALMFSSNVPIETMLSRPPTVIFDPDPASRAASLRRSVLGKAGYSVVEERFPRTLINCGGTAIAPAMRVLADARRRLPS